MIRDWLHRVIPQDVYGWIVCMLGSMTSLLFPAPAEVYQGLFVLIMIDTITGWLAAYKRKRVNSKTFRRKFFPKIIQYLVTITALYTAKTVLVNTITTEIANAILGFTLAGIVYTEVKSIIENTKALTGVSTSFMKDEQELLEFLEANHIRGENVSHSVQSRNTKHSGRKS